MVIFFNKNNEAYIWSYLVSDVLYCQGVWVWCWHIIDIMQTTVIKWCCIQSTVFFRPLFWKRTHSFAGGTRLTDVVFCRRWRAPPKKHIFTMMQLCLGLDDMAMCVDRRFAKKSHSWNYHIEVSFEKCRQVSMSIQNGNCILRSKCMHKLFHIQNSSCNKAVKHSAAKWRITQWWQQAQAYPLTFEILISYTFEYKMYFNVSRYL